MSPPLFLTLTPGRRIFALALSFNRLTSIQVKVLPSGRHADGRGLYLLVRPAGGAWWVLRYKRDGRVREAGIGPARGGDALTLAEARVKADGIWRMHKGGLDPLAEKAEAKARAVADAQDRKARMVSFRAAAEAYMAAHEAGWKNPKHRAQWAVTLKTYVYAHMGELPVGEVDTPHIEAALTPIWTTKPETASRVRGRIEVILDFAKLRKWRDGENPARWKGSLKGLFPARAKVAAVEHFAALPYKDIGGFMVELAGVSGVAAMALRFTILTAARTGEVIGATWSEIDEPAGVWIVPAARMKAGKEHRVPLSAPALAILAEVRKLRTIDGPAAPVFPGVNGARGLSKNALLVTLHRLGHGTITAHGFRSTFRDWASETTTYPSEAGEAALAHVIADKTEAAYRRGDLFEKRRRLMEDWATYCGRLAPTTGEVLSMRRA